MEIRKLPRLNIGCGTHEDKHHEYINCDLFTGPSVDVIFNATKSWPFKDDSIGQVRCNHTLEHLSKPMDFFRCAWRALISNGQLVVTVPYGASTAGIADVAHLSYWLPGSFCCLQPGYGAAVFNPQYSQWKEYFSVDFCLLRIAGTMRRLVRWPFKWIGMKILAHLWDAYNEVSVCLRAIKSQASIDDFLKWRDGNAIPLQRVMHKHDYDGKPCTSGEIELIFFDRWEMSFEQIGKIKE